jgi:protein-disulfide isomerase
MKKPVLAAMALLILLLSGGVSAHTDDAAIPERVLGKKDAPITVQEFASLTCSHCADFYNTVMPELEKRYIETGKVRFIFRDFPLDGLSLKAAAIAHCMPAEQFYPFISVLYKNLTTWAFSDKAEQMLLQYAKLGGLDEAKAKACLQDTKKLDAIVAQRTEATEKYDINSTPTFIINDGQEKLTGARSVDEFAALFDKLLAAKK